MILMLCEKNRKNWVSVPNFFQLHLPKCTGEVFHCRRTYVVWQSFEKIGAETPEKGCIMAALCNTHGDHAHTFRFFEPDHLPDLSGQGRSTESKLFRIIVAQAGCRSCRPTNSFKALKANTAYISKQLLDEVALDWKWFCLNWWNSEQSRHGTAPVTSPLTKVLYGATQLSFNFTATCELFHSCVALYQIPVMWTRKSCTDGSVECCAPAPRWCDLELWPFDPKI